MNLMMDNMQMEDNMQMKQKFDSILFWGKKF